MPKQTACRPTKESERGECHDPPKFFADGPTRTQHCQRCSQNCDPLLNERQMRSPPNSCCWICFLGDSLQLVARTLADAGCVPHLSFSPVDADATVTVQIHVQRGVDRPHSVRGGCRHVHVVQERHRAAPRTTGEASLRLPVLLLRPDPHGARHRHCLLTNTETVAHRTTSRMGVLENHLPHHGELPTSMREISDQKHRSHPRS